MNKISGILQSSPRVTSVDLSNAPHQRVGGPDFGLPRSGGSDRLEGAKLSAYERLQKANLLQKEDIFGPAHEVKIARDLTKSFFNTRLEDADKTEAAIETPDVEDLGYNPADLADVIVEVEAKEMDPLIKGQNLSIAI
jgi:hypothetical protein